MCFCYVTMLLGLKFQQQALFFMNEERSGTRGRFGVIELFINVVAGDERCCFG